MKIAKYRWYTTKIEIPVMISFYRKLLKIRRYYRYFDNIGEILAISCFFSKKWSVRIQLSSVPMSALSIMKCGKIPFDMKLLKSVIRSSFPQWCAQYSSGKCLALLLFEESSQRKIRGISKEQPKVGRSECGSMTTSITKFLHSYLLFYLFLTTGATLYPGFQLRLLFFGRFIFHVAITCYFHYYSYFCIPKEIALSVLLICIHIY